MNDNSISSIFLVILIALFFVLPSILKLLGQYTLGSKGIERREQPDNKDNPREIHIPERPSLEYPEENHPRAGNGHDHTVISNEPIKPKWF